MLLLSPAHGQATHTIDPCAERIPLPPVDHKSSEFSAAPRVLSQSPSFSVQNRASSDEGFGKSTRHRGRRGSTEAFGGRKPEDQGGLFGIHLGR